jgi:hypothetical protein
MLSFPRRRAGWTNRIRCVVRFDPSISRGGDGGGGTYRELPPSISFGLPTLASRTPDAVVRISLIIQSSRMKSVIGALLELVWAT